MVCLRNIIVYTLHKGDTEDDYDDDDDDDDNNKMNTIRYFNPAFVLRPSCIPENVGVNTKGVNKKKLYSLEK